MGDGCSVCVAELPDDTNLFDALPATPCVPRLMEDDLTMANESKQVSVDQPPPPARGTGSPAGPLSRALGPTAGPQAGNVRAIIAILSVVALHAITVLLIVRNDPAYRDATLALLSAITAADVSFASAYFGKRQGDGA